MNFLENDELCLTQNSQNIELNKKMSLGNAVSHLLLRANRQTNKNPTKQPKKLTKTNKQISHQPNINKTNTVETQGLRDKVTEQEILG